MPRDEASRFALILRVFEPAIAVQEAIGCN